MQCVSVLVSLDWEGNQKNPKQRQNQHYIITPTLAQMIVILFIYFQFYSDHELLNHPIVTVKLLLSKQNNNYFNAKTHSTWPVK